MFAKLVRALLAFAIVSIAPCAAAEAPPIFVGGQFIRQHALDDQRGHVLVPVRGIFEALGASVTYTAPRIVVVRKAGSVVAGLVIGRRSAVVANRARYLGAAPIRRGGRIYVPLRSIAEIAGASVTYSTRPRLVDIRLPNNELAVSMPMHDMPAMPPDPTLPIWGDILIGVCLSAFVIELSRRVGVAALGRRPPRGLRRAAGPLALHALKLPDAGGARHQNGMREISE